MSIEGTSGPDQRDERTTSASSLSHSEKDWIFREAMRGLVYQCGDRFEDVMTDGELEAAPKASLGIFGGSGGPQRLSVTYQRAGLKIWGGWHVVNHIQEQPLFQGRATRPMA